MVIRVSEIPEGGLVVTSPTVLGSLFADEGWSVDQVDLVVQRQSGKVAVSGGFAVTARLTCSRCLDPLESRVIPQVDLQLRPMPRARQEQGELSADDLEVDFYQGDLLDLGGLVRSETDLALPMKPLCRPDCQGLCPSCGANRNAIRCSCGGRTIGPHDGDPRLASLEALRPRP